MKRIGLLIVLAFFLSSCVLGTRRPLLTYTTILPTANKNNITIKIAPFKDKRTWSKEKLGDVRNGYGMRCADIIPQNSVTEWVADAFNKELTNAGYTVSSDANAAVNIEGSLLEVYVNAYMYYGGRVRMNIVLKKDGKEVLTEEYFQQKKCSMKWAATADSYAKTIEMTLQDIMMQVIPDINDALLKRSSAGAIIPSESLNYNAKPSSQINYNDAANYLNESKKVDYERAQYWKEKGYDFDSMSVEYRLKRLEELLDQKVITEEEYASNRKIILASLSDATNKEIKETSTENRSNEIQKANVDENKSASNKVEETKNTNQASVASNDGLLVADHIESGVTDKQNPILVEWDKWVGVDRPKVQALTSDLKSRLIEEYVKSKYSNSPTYKEKMDSLISLLKNHEGVEATTIKNP
jgi:uncharacterized lipoprotein YajG